MEEKVTLPNYPICLPGYLEMNVVTTKMETRSETTLTAMRNYRDRLGQIVFFFEVAKLLVLRPVQSRKHKNYSLLRPFPESAS